MKKCALGRIFFSNTIFSMTSDPAYANKWWQKQLLGTTAASTAIFWRATFVLALMWCWLIPNRYVPLSEFYNDWWMAVCLGVSLAVLMYRYRSNTVTWPTPAIAFFCLAAIPFVQWSVGLIPTRGQAILSATYVLGIALAFWGGWAWHLKMRWRAMDILLAAILCSALINVGIALMQFFGIYPYDDINFPGILIFQIAQGVRPTGNLAQANIAGTHFIWGLFALWWFVERRQLRWPLMLAASVYLTAAIALTQSRTSWVNLAALSVVAICVNSRWIYKDVRWPNKFWRMQPVFWSVLVISWLAALDWIGHQFGVGGGVREVTFQDSARVMAYLTFLKALTLSPWVGYGMTHLASAQMAAAPDGVELGVYFFHSHNIFLDFLLWFGIPSAMLCILALIWLLVRLMSHVNNAPTLVLAMILMVFGVHTLFELPHMWGIMLFPVAWCGGALWASRPRSNGVRYRSERTLVKVPRIAILTLFTSMVMTLTILMWDYQMIVREFWTLRMDNARIGPRGLDNVEAAIILDHLENRLRLARINDADLKQGASVEWIDRASKGYPSPSTHFLHIKALALRGSTQLALTEMQRLNRATSKPVLVEFTKRWVDVQQLHPELALPPWVVSGALLASDKKNVVKQGSAEF